MLADGKGLYLRVSPTGAKSWIYRYRVDGRRHDLGLGPFPDVALAEARGRASEQRKLRLSGQDPLLTRRGERDQARLSAARTMTFKACAEAYMAAHRASWRHPKHRQQWENTLSTYVYPTFGDLAVSTVSVGLVIKAIEPLWATKPETASRVRGRIEVVLDWAKVRGYREGENPARWRGHLENLLPARSKAKRAVRQAKGKGEHHAAMAYSEIGTFIAALRNEEGVAPRALEFAILTAARTSEVVGARWAEINLPERLWVVPAERMKAGKEHRVPLSGRVVEIIEEMRTREAEEVVFPGRRPRLPLSNMALLMLLRRMHHADLTVHGFRSSFRDWAAERTNFPAEVAEMALAHVVSDKVEAAYRRGDLFERRRKIMEAWAQFCATLPKSNEQVVPIRPRMTEEVTRA